MDLPSIALSVRQPWAWAIIHGGKDIENRTRWRVWRHGRIAIHAAKGMTLDEYRDAENYMRLINVKCLSSALLARGGIVGTVELVDVVTESASPWFEGPYGFVLRDPRPCEFIPARGALGFFKWKETR